MDIKITIDGKPARSLMLRYKGKRAAITAAKRFCFFIEKNHWPTAEDLASYQ